MMNGMLCSLCCVLLAVVAVSAESLLVQTNSGYVQGVKLNVDNGRAVHAWLGIPYAEKPVRFQRPVAAKNWSGTFDASRLPNTCFQLFTVTNNSLFDSDNPNTPLSEDCLYLNVWSPIGLTSSTQVFVWIHGGSFKTGSSTSSRFDPRIMVAQTNAVFVSIQYRLSILGFMYLNDTSAPGNMGLLDQSLALKWVRDNIQMFGGDPSRITIFGESAGSASVSFHLLSPLSMNSFTNAVMESGTSTASWATMDSKAALALSIATLNYVGCSGTNIAQLVSCASQIDVSTLMQRAAVYAYRVAQGNYNFIPVVDNYFLPDTPSNILSQGKFKKCPLLIGVNQYEANAFYLIFPEYQNFMTKPALSYARFVAYLKIVTPYYPAYPTNITNQQMQAVINEYTYWPNPNDTNAIFDNLNDAFTDYQFIYPAITYADAYASFQQNVYFYYFTQASTQNGYPTWFGAKHADEIPFVFGQPFNSSFSYTKNEVVLSGKMLQYWNNFAQYGDPNGITSDMLSNWFCIKCWWSNFYLQWAKVKLDKWPVYQLIANTDKQRAYLTLNGQGNSIGYNLRPAWCAFWQKFLPYLA